MRILVVGATGMLGQPVARKLRADGYEVRLLVRDFARARRLLGDDFELVAGDVTRPDTLVSAMEQCNAVYASLRGGNTVESYHRVERDGGANIAACARQCGVGRLVWLSGAGIGEVESASPVFHAKAAAITAVIGSGVEYTVFKPAHFMESLPQFIHGGRAIVIGRQPHRYHYLAAADYAELVSRSFRMREAANQSFTVFGPEAFTMTEALQRYCGRVHPGMRVQHMPLFVARALARLTCNADLAFAATLFDGFSRLGEPGDPAPTARLLGAPRTSLEQWCAQQTGKRA